MSEACSVTMVGRGRPGHVSPSVSKLPREGAEPQLPAPLQGQAPGSVLIPWLWDPGLPMPQFPPVSLGWDKDGTGGWTLPGTQLLPTLGTQGRAAARLKARPSPGTLLCLTAMPACSSGGFGRHREKAGWHLGRMPPVWSGRASWRKMQVAGEELEEGEQKSLLRVVGPQEDPRWEKGEPTSRAECECPWAT